MLPHIATVASQPFAASPSQSKNPPSHAKDDLRNEWADGELASLTAGDLHDGAPRSVPASSHLDAMLARVDRHRRPDDDRRDARAVARDGDVVRRGILRKEDREPRQPRLERRDVLLGKRDALSLSFPLGDGQGLGELGPRRRRLAFELVAAREVEERPQPRVEPLALGEERTRLRMPSVRGERTGAIEELRRQRAVRGRRVGERRPRRERHGEARQRREMQRPRHTRTSVHESASRPAELRPEPHFRGMQSGLR